MKASITDYHGNQVDRRDAHSAPPSGSVIIAGSRYRPTAVATNEGSIDFSQDVASCEWLELGQPADEVVGKDVLVIGGIPASDTQWQNRIDMGLLSRQSIFASIARHSARR